MPSYITLEGVTDTSPVTVNTLLSDPNVIPLRILSMANQLFIADQLLRKAPSGWVYEYRQSTPLFDVSTPDIVTEFGEYPIGQGQIGPLSIAKAQKRGLGLSLSEEMRTRNQIDFVNMRIMQITNTMVQTFDAAFFAAVSNAVTLTRAATAAWSSGSANPQKDIAQAKKQIVDTKFGFVPDTLVLDTTAVANLLGNPAVWPAWTGDVAHLNPGVTGLLPAQFLGLDVWATYSLTNVALVLQREVLGFIGDEYPLGATPMRWREDNDSYRTNIRRSSAVAIDQSNAVASVTAVGP
jgi:hypothetical protein